MLTQEWRDVAFLHWPYRPEVVRPLVPSRLELDTFQDRAWVSAIAFRIPRMRPMALPPLPGMRSGAEAHLRTYVAGPDGRRGVWFLSLDIDPVMAAVLGRLGFLLPYWWARIRTRRTRDRAWYQVRRMPGGSTRLDLRLRPGEARTEVGPLDRFLTARWVMYLGVGPVSASVVVEHAPWPLRTAAVEGLEETMLARVGLPPPEVPPIVHFSDGVDARIGWPQPAVRPLGMEPTRRGTR
jgi:uncharacterized protein YqjF (DUF2071 family)